MIKTEVLECSDCLIELKEGEGKQSLDGSILCTDCKEDEIQNERLSDILEEQDPTFTEEFSEVRESLIEMEADERLDSLEDN